jgi:hypothetical protein
VLDIKCRVRARAYRMGANRKFVLESIVVADKGGSTRIRAGGLSFSLKLFDAELQVQSLWSITIWRTGSKMDKKDERKWLS